MKIYANFSTTHVLRGLVFKHLETKSSTANDTPTGSPHTNNQCCNPRPATGRLTCATENKKLPFLCTN